MAGRSHLKRTQIVGTGSAVPEKVLTNFDLEKMVDTSDEWIRVRTGIQRRHIADEKTTSATLASEAAQKALKDAGLSAQDVDFILVATVTPDMPFPATGCLVQESLGATKAAAMDLSAGCSGFIYALSLADALIRSGNGENILVIGVETLSKIIDWTDRNTCVLFGDGAGAVVLTPTEEEGRGLIASHARSDGSLGALLMLPGGGSKNSTSLHTVEQRMHFIKMNGHDLFRPAILSMVEAALCVLQKAGLNSEQVDLLIPHQANLRIIDAVAKKLKLPREKVYVNLDEYGNTSAASIPIALDEAKRKGVIRPDNLVLMVAFGAGLTWGAALLRV